MVWGVLVDNLNALLEDLQREEGSTPKYDEWNDTAMAKRKRKRTT